MNAFPQPLTGIAAPIPGVGQVETGLGDNIDTDTIIPSREMRSTGREGLASGLFAPWRYSDASARIENPDFALNQPKFRNAPILVAGHNFGCGSSREHAVWALAEYGVRAVLAESFAPIFHGNALRNFILPISAPRDALHEFAGRIIAVDLEAQQVRSQTVTHDFDIDPEAKHMLAEGLDAIDLTLTQSADIEAWTAADRPARPWIYLEQSR